MIIKQCYIENFGKFSSKTFDFNNDLVSLNEENGWGKTTLAAFIKAMLYGMEENKGRSKEFIEREKYHPWQGGNYGGSMVFTVGGNEYKVTRIFDEKKKKDDKFELTDMKSGKRSSKYSEDIGKEIFDINLDTFERSVFVNLDDDKIPCGTADITTKLTNLVTAADDVSNFDKANSILENKSKELKASRGSSGKINELLQKITSDENTIISIEDKEKNVKTWQGLVDKQTESISEKNKIVKKLQDEFSLSAKYKDKEKYLLLKKQNEENIKSQKQILDFFNGKIPEEATLDSISSKYNECKEYNALLKENPVTEADRLSCKEINSFFKGDIPSTDEISSCQKYFDKYNSLLQEKAKHELSEDDKEEYLKLKKLFDGKNITSENIDSYLSDYEKVQNLNNEISLLKANKNTAENELSNEKKKQKNIVKNIFFVLTGVFLAASILSFLCIKKPLFNIASGLVIAICFGALSVISLVLGIVKKNPKEKITGKEKAIEDISLKIKEKENESLSLQKRYMDFIFEFYKEQKNISVTVLLSNIKNDFAQFLKLKKTMQDYENWASLQTVTSEDFKKKILAFEIKYNQVQDVSMISSILDVLREKINKLTDFEKKIKEFDKNKESFTLAKSELNEFLKSYNTDKTQNYEKQIQNCREQKRDYTQLEESEKTIQNEISKFEKENDVNELEKISKPQKSTEELQKQIDVVTNEINSITNEKIKLTQSIENYLPDIDSKGDIELDLEQSKIELDKSKASYEILQKTMECLKAAKDSLEKKYMDPMKKNFEKYITLLDDKLSFNIDTGLNVSVDTKLKSYSSDYLSNGYKDLVNFCARMALVDSLFKTEKPAVILDDPFVNLDGEKITKALDLVKNISKEKQVVYFTCHESRNI